MVMRRQIAKGYRKGPYHLFLFIFLLMQMWLIALPLPPHQSAEGGGARDGPVPRRTRGDLMNLAQKSARTDEMLDTFQRYWKLRISFSPCPFVRPSIRLPTHPIFQFCSSRVDALSPAWRH